jgi:hypothetical protein
MDNDFYGFDSPEHDAAQAECMHIINHAINAETKRAAWQALTNARHTGDGPGLTLAMAQFSEKCEHRLPPKVTDALVEAVKSHAQEHYKDGGWDVIVECWTDGEIRERLTEHKAHSLAAALKAFEPLIDVWSDRQADARNSAF